MIIGGAALPAVRVELNPLALSRYGVGLEDVRAALVERQRQQPKGAIEIGDQRWQIYTNDQAQHAADYRASSSPTATATPVRLKDVADVEDSVQDLRNLGPRQRQAGGAGHRLPPAGRQHHRRPSTRSERRFRS